MGFMDKLKAANGMNLGRIESPDFPGGVLVVKNGKLIIMNGAMNGPNYERAIQQLDIRIFKLIGCGGTWAKYYLEFKDGKSGIITQDVISEAQRQSGISMTPIERHIKIVDPQLYESNVVISNHNQETPAAINNPTDKKEVVLESVEKQAVVEEEPIEESNTTHSEEKETLPKDTEEIIPAAKEQPAEEPSKEEEKQVAVETKEEQIELRSNPTVEESTQIRTKPSGLSISNNKIVIKNKAYNLSKVEALSVIGSELHFVIGEKGFVVEYDYFSEASKMYDTIDKYLSH